MVLEPADSAARPARVSLKPWALLRSGGRAAQYKLFKLCLQGHAIEQLASLQYIYIYIYTHTYKHICMYTCVYTVYVYVQTYYRYAYLQKEPHYGIAYLNLSLGSSRREMRQ